jgi:hypothetical protein
MPLTASTPIMLATAPVDFRCGIDGLAGLCQHGWHQNQGFEGGIFSISEGTAKINRLVRHEAATHLRRDSWR